MLRIVRVCVNMSLYCKFDRTHVTRYVCETWFIVCKKPLEATEMSFLRRTLKVSQASSSVSSLLKNTATKLRTHYNTDRRPHLSALASRPWALLVLTYTELLSIAIVSCFTRVANKPSHRRLRSSTSDQLLTLSFRCVSQSQNNRQTVTSFQLPAPLEWSSLPCTVTRGVIRKPLKTSFRLSFQGRTYSWVGTLDLVSLRSDTAIPSRQLAYLRHNVQRTYS